MRHTSFAGWALVFDAGPERSELSSLKEGRELYAEFLYRPRGGGIRRPTGRYKANGLYRSYYKKRNRGELRARSQDDVGEVALGLDAGHDGSEFSLV